MASMVQEKKRWIKMMEKRIKMASNSLTVQWGRKRQAPKALPGLRKKSGRNR